MSGSFNSDVLLVTLSSSSSIFLWSCLIFSCFSFCSAWEDSSVKLKTTLIKYACIRHVPILLAEKEKNKKVNSEERRERKCFGEVRNRVRVKRERGAGH